MNKKYLGWTLFWVIVVGGLIILAVLYPGLFGHGGDHDSGTPHATTTGGNVHNVDEADLLPLIQKARVNVPDTTSVVALTNGEGSFTVDQSEGFVVADDIVAIQHIDNGHDVFAKLAVNYGGSGTFTYLALFSVEGETVTHRGSYPIGDRVRIEKVDLGAVNGTTYTATVTYLDRKPDEPLAAEPTERKTATVTVMNHQFKK
jgi:hypothetical protein